MLTVVNKAEGSHINYGLLKKDEALTDSLNRIDTDSSFLFVPFYT